MGADSFALGLIPHPPAYLNGQFPWIPLPAFLHPVFSPIPSNPFSKGSPFHPSPPQSRPSPFRIPIAPQISNPTPLFTFASICVSFLHFPSNPLFAKMTRAEKRRELVERLEGKLPPGECTDFNLDRWLDAYEEDVDRCVETIGEYMKNRKALGLDRPEGFDGFFTRPDMIHYYGVFTQSKPMTSWINSYDNGIVFVETGVSDALKACKVIRSGDFLHCFMRSCEFFLQLVLEQEKKTGKRSYGVCIFDMRQMSILQYVNPMAPINRIFEARIGILMAFYAEMLSQVVIVNPPRLLSALVKIMSILLPAKVLSRFHIASNPLDVEKWISPDAIPLAFGGTKVIDGADCPETGCNAPLEYGKDQFLRDGEIWERHGIKGVEYENCSVGAGESYVKELEAKRGQTLMFEYFANRNFEIRVENEDGDYLLPRIKMCSPLLAEEGAVKIEKNGRVKWELKNLSRMMRMKLRIALRLIE